MRIILFSFLAFLVSSSCDENVELKCGCETYLAEEFEKGLKEVSLKPCLLESDYPNKMVPFSFEQAEALSNRHNCQ